MSSVLYAISFCRQERKSGILTFFCDPAWRPSGTRHRAPNRPAFRRKPPAPEHAEDGHPPHLNAHAPVVPAEAGTHGHCACDPHPRRSREARRTATTKTHSVVKEPSRLRLFRPTGKPEILPAPTKGFKRKIRQRNTFFYAVGFP